MSCAPQEYLDLAKHRDITYFVDTQNLFQEPPPETEAWKEYNEQEIATIPFDEKTFVWFAAKIPESSNFNTIFTRSCTNLSAVYQNKELVAADLAQRNYPLSTRIFGSEVMVRLPVESGASTLYLKTVYSAKTKYNINCATFDISSPEGSLWRLLSVEANNTIVGFIVLFLGLIGLIVMYLRPQKELIYFSAFALTMGVVYLTGGSLIEIVIDRIESWPSIWHFAVTFAPIPFFLFFNEILPTRNQITKWMAYLGLVVYGFMLFGYFTNPSFNLDQFRRYFFNLLIIELLFLIPITVQGIFLRRPYAIRLGLGFVGFVTAAVHDVYNLLYVSREVTWLLPWFLIAFIVILLTIIINLAIQQEALLEKQKAQIIIDRNRHLLNEVELRTTDLNKRSKELEQLHNELEDRHELLVSQKRKVQELVQEKDMVLHQLHNVKSKALPAIIKDLQGLHFGENEELKTEVKEYVAYVLNVLDNVAQRYAQRSHIFHRRVVFLDADKKNQRVYKLALGGSKLELSLTEKTESLLQLLTESPHELIAVHQNYWPDLAQIRARLPYSTILLLSQGSSPENLQHMANSASPIQVLPLTLPRPILQKIILIHVTKWISQEFFGLEKYLVWGSKVKEGPFFTGAEHDAIVSAMHQDLASVAISEESLQRLSEVGRNLLQIKDLGILVRRDKHGEQPWQQLRYGYDAHFLIVSIEFHNTLIPWKDLAQVLSTHASGDNVGIPEIRKVFQLCDTIVLNSNGVNQHEILAIIHLEHVPPEDNVAAFYYFTPNVVTTHTSDEDRKA